MEEIRSQVDIKKLHEDFHALLDLMEEFRNSVIDTFNELSKWYKETQEIQHVFDSVGTKPSKNGRISNNKLNIVDEPYDPLEWVSSVEIGSLFGIKSRFVHNLAEKERFRAIRLPNSKKGIRYSLMDAEKFLGQIHTKLQPSSFLVTVEYAMAWLGITDFAVRKLVSSGALTNVGPPGRIVIPFSSLVKYDQWVKSKPGANQGEDTHKGVLIK